MNIQNSRANSMAGYATDPDSFLKVCKGQKQDKIGTSGTLVLSVNSYSSLVSLPRDE